MPKTSGLSTQVPANYDSATFSRIVSAICSQLDNLSEGRLSGRYYNATVVPGNTAMSGVVSDIVWDANATVKSTVAPAVGLNYVRLGWINTVPGTPGTWQEIRVLTGGGSISRITGTTTNDDAQAGDVGEYISAQVTAGAAVGVSNGSATNVASVSLTAGDWDVGGNVIFAPNAATVTTTLLGTINTVASTLPGAPNGGAYTFNQFSTGITGVGEGLNVGPKRISLSSTTTVYLIAYSVFTTNTQSAYGFIGARRVR